MKKFLSMVGVCLLSFALFVGCGIDTKANEEMGAKLTSALTTVSHSAANLDATSAQEFATLAQEIQDYATGIVKDPTQLDSQEKVDEVTAKYEEYYNKLKTIADSNNITLSDGESSTSAAK